MVNAFQTTFQASHDKRDLDFKGHKSSTLEEKFTNLNFHDHSFDVDDIGLYFGPYSLASSDCSIPWIYLKTLYPQI